MPRIVYSQLDSVVPEVAALRFVRLPKDKVLTNVKVLNRAGRNVMMLFENGDLHCWYISPAPNHGGGCYLPGEWHVPILEACVKIGALSQDAFDRHVAAYQQSWNAKRVERDLVELNAMIERYNKPVSRLKTHLEKTAVRDQKVATYHKQRVSRR